MKKIYTLIACFTLTGMVFGQNASPNLESFELPDLPQCWSVLDADGDGDNWANFYAIDDGAGGLIPGNTGVGSMTSASFINGVGPLTPDNFLILPQLDVQAGENLTYAVAGLDASYSLEKYAVVLSTGGSAAADFTETLFEETLASADFESRDVDLSAYVGQQVYIAFRHYDVTDQFQMRIDDVQYPTTVDDCAIIVSTEEVAEAVEFNVFPNPSTGIVNVELNAAQDQLVEVYNLSGQVVFTETYRANSGTVSMDLSSVAKGIYTLSLTSEGTVSTEKLVLR